MFLYCSGLVLGASWFLVRATISSTRVACWSMTTFLWKYLRTYVEIKNNLVVMGEWLGYMKYSWYPLQRHLHSQSQWCAFNTHTHTHTHQEVCGSTCYLDMLAPMGYDCSHWFHPRNYIFSCRGIVSRMIIGERQGKHITTIGCVEIAFVSRDLDSSCPSWAQQLRGSFMGQMKLTWISLSISSLTILK